MTEITRPESPGAQYLKLLKRRGKLHLDEEIVDALTDAFEQDVKDIVEFMTTEGRPVFTIQLTDEEKLLRFLDPLQRDVIIEEERRRGGDAGVKQYVNAMFATMKRLTYGQRTYGVT